MVAAAVAGSNERRIASVEIASRKTGDPAVCARSVWRSLAFELVFGTSDGMAGRLVRSRYRFSAVPPGRKLSRMRAERSGRSIHRQPAAASPQNSAQRDADDHIGYTACVARAPLCCGGDEPTLRLCLLEKR